MLALFRRIFGQGAARVRRTPFLGRKGPADQPEPTVEADPPEAKSNPVDHSAHTKADPYTFEAAHRRLAWLFRLVVMICVGQFAAIISLTSAISELVPLKEVQMGLVRIEQRDDKAVPVDPASLVRVLPVTKDTPGFDLMMEAFVRRYVRILLEIDPVSQDDRMREANLHSDTDWWKEFIAKQKKEIDAAIKSGLIRSIVVESADRISERNGTFRYAVDFVQTDTRRGEVVEVKRLRAYLPVTARPRSVKPSEKFENPQGFRSGVVVLKERGNS